MRRVLADIDPLEHLADRVGERPAARKHYDPATAPESRQGFDHQLEGAGLAEQAAADLHDRVD